jgi:hypothetical protein
MARIDDYLSARQIAIEKLSKENMDDIIARTGFEVGKDCTFKVPFLGRICRVGFPDFRFVDDSDETKEVPIQEQILVLHFMITGSAAGLIGNWIAYREIPGATFYFSAFTKRAVDPLKKVFGHNLSGFSKIAEQLHGNPLDIGDAAFEFTVFPNVPLRLILWEGDEEFPPEANIIFDESIGNIFSPEDVAWLAGMLVYRLIALSKM